MGTIKEEALHRLDILINQGVTTDINIASLFYNQNIICTSCEGLIFNEPIGTVIPLSALPTTQYNIIVKYISNLESVFPYFCMLRYIEESYCQLFVFTVSKNQNLWDSEREQLFLRKPDVYFFDINSGIIKCVNIYYSILHGGPVITSFSEIVFHQEISNNDYITYKNTKALHTAIDIKTDVSEISRPP